SCSPSTCPIRGGPGMHSGSTGTNAATKRYRCGMGKRRDCTASLPSRSAGTSAEAREPRWFFFSCRRRHTRSKRDWSSDVCSSDLYVWIRGRQVGGRSIMWGRQTYRWSDLDFEANAKDGFGVDWPIRYADIAPWYDHVERFVGISGQAEGLGQLPDGQFLPPMGMTCAETHVRDAVAKYWGRDRVVTIGRCAVLTQSHNGRAACHYCGPCHRG